jgi:antitoxin component of MazEF toxin-antitoxin module
VAHQIIHLKTKADGSIHIPADVVSQAGLAKNSDVQLHVSDSRLTLFSPSDTSALISAFAARMKAELGDLDSDYRMSDGHTLKEYLALSEEQRDALWESAYREALDELEKEPEQDASADYVPAGQGHRASGV